MPKIENMSGIDLIKVSIGTSSVFDSTLVEGIEVGNLKMGEPKKIKCNYEILYLTGYDLDGNIDFLLELIDASKTQFHIIGKDDLR